MESRWNLPDLQMNVVAGVLSYRGGRVRSRRGGRGPGWGWGCSTSIGLPMRIALDEGEHPTNAPTATRHHTDFTSDLSRKVIASAKA